MKSLFKVYHPEVFQGSLRNRNYFEGWYFKHVSADTEHAFAVIAGISLSDDSHSFIQYIDGNTGKSSYFRYGSEDFKFSTRRFEIQIGESFFSRDSIRLNLENSDFRITGEIKYSGTTPIPKSILMPGIMGWYSFVPGMECNHGVVSAGHKTEGSIVTNGTITNFNGGRGYIEKDWGTSFPESWLWLQCNNFEKNGISLMISIARIPWKGSWFMGLISFISTGIHTEIMATYNRAKVSLLSRVNDNNTGIMIRKGSLTLSATITKRGAGILKAPSMGVMNSLIKESLNSEVLFELKEGSHISLSGRGVRAGYEETDNIFSYFR